MSVIINDHGFSQSSTIDYDQKQFVFIDPANYHDAPDFGSAQLITVHFSDFSDGRGFGIARDLRRSGYKGKMRASGYLIADQYTMSRRVGFDEVEISDELAQRQGEDQWKARSNWEAFDYQKRLGQKADIKDE